MPEASLGLTIVGVVMGSVLFRLLVAIALLWGLNPNDLKLITAAFVFVALILPNLLGKLKTKRSLVPERLKTKFLPLGHKDTNI